MKLSDYNYELPDELIVNRPPQKRGDSNLLFLNRQTQKVSKHKYFELVDFLREGDCLVLNETKVIPARIITHKQSGGEREIVILERHGDNLKQKWFEHKIMYRRKLKIGDELFIDNHKITIKEILGGGIAIATSEVDLLELCQKYGEPPLPPYMNRTADESDKQRYQTIFAKKSGSVAAPTASLNMTDEILSKLERKNVKIVRITLHVGLGTFLPIRTDKIENHKMHQEYFEIPQAAAAEIYQAHQNKQRVVAVGTTVARTLEFAHQQIIDLGVKLTNEPEHAVAKISGEADIFIYPGYQFKMIDGLLTNFHAPKSTVLMMAAAFAGWDFLMQSYDFAKAEKMRFLSYGDSMLII